jgi:hypothetical protein
VRNFEAFEIVVCAVPLPSYQIREFAMKEDERSERGWQNIQLKRK